MKNLIIEMKKNWTMWLIFALAIVYVSCKSYRKLLSLAPKSYNLLSKGQEAPDFECKYVSLKTQAPTKIKLSDYRGHKVILYFYPKDDTPICKNQAKSFRDNIDVFRSLNYRILGVSIDSSESHVNYIKKYNLPFKLLVDKNHNIHDKYGAWSGKHTYRMTFIIDKKGFIKKIMTKINPINHAQQILDSDPDYKELKKSKKV